MHDLVLSREQSRAIDRVAIEQLGVSGRVLMENAGRGCVDVLENLGISGKVAILCGKGNNAGDGFVIARHLLTRKHEAVTILLNNPHELQGDAKANYAVLCKLPTQIVIAPAASGHPSLESHPSLTEFLAMHFQSANWIVDALLGSGAQGHPRFPFDAAIKAINGHQPTTRVLAVDMPSGLDCDSGEPAPITVRADHTCTFAAKKSGFSNLAAAEFLGVVHVCDIGVPVPLQLQTPREDR